MLCEKEHQLFRVLLNFHECFYNSRRISFKKYRDAQKKINWLTLIIKILILFAFAMITSTARAISVSVLSIFIQ